MGSNLDNAAEYLLKLKENPNNDTKIATENKENNAKRATELENFRSTAVTAWNNYERILRAYDLADAKLVQLKAALDLIGTEKGTDSVQYQIAKAYYDEAVAWLAAKKAALATEFGVDAKDLARQEDGALVVAFNALFVRANSDEVIGMGDNKISSISLVVEDVKREGKLPAESTGSTDTESVDEDSRYHVSNNNVVAVTYGDRATKTPYKTFLLNYNSYAVRVTYLGIVYTVEAGGYVMIPRAD